MTKRANRLFDLEIDEVSSVDVPANQHGIVAITKSLTMGATTVEGGMGYTDATGNPVDEADLAHGDVVYNEAGEEFVFVADDAQDQELELAGVGKAFPGANAFRSGYQSAKAGMEGPAAGRAEQFGRHVGRNRKRYAAGAAGVATGGAIAGAASKAAGEDILAELSKAVTDEQRHTIISKALQEAAATKAELEEVRKELDQEREVRYVEGWIAKAAEYELPVDETDLGIVLAKAATVLEDTEIDLLDRVLSTVAKSAMFDEVGFAGQGSNSVYDQVQAQAQQLVQKAAGNFSLEEAAVAMFDANPDAYLAFLSEQNGR